MRHQKITPWPVLQYLTHFDKDYIPDHRTRVYHKNIKFSTHHLAATTTSHQDA